MLLSKFVMVALAVMLLSAPEAFAIERIEGKAIVIDGDSIEINGTWIRFYGIDAAERDQQCLDEANTRWACGAVATTTLKSAVNGIDVVCEARGKDSFGRILASCKARSLDLNMLMVQSGLALAFVEHSQDYVENQAFAREMKVGMWRGAFIAPWDWRVKRDEPTVMSAGSVPKKTRAKLLELSKTR